MSRYTDLIELLLSFLFGSSIHYLDHICCLLFLACLIASLSLGFLHITSYLVYNMSSGIKLPVFSPINLVPYGAGCYLYYSLMRNKGDDKREVLYLVVDR